MCQGQGGGGVGCTFIINCLFLLFIIIYFVDGVGGKFAISLILWVIGVSGSRILGENAGGISVVGRCGVDCVLISHVIYVPL